MKKWIIAALMGISFQTAFSQIIDVDRIVAVVDNDIITLSELNARITETKAQLGTKTNLPPNETLKAQILEQMINERILIQYADSTGIRVSETDIDQAIASLAHQNKSSVENFYSNMQKKGISRKRLRQGVMDEMMIERVRQREINSRVSVTDSEVAQELSSSQHTLQNRQIHFAAILIKAPPSNETSALEPFAKKAAAALAAIKQGKSFASVAKQYSDLPNKNSGGDMGPKAVGQLPPDLVTVLSALQKGQSSSIIRSPEGFYIFQLIDQKDSGKNRQMIKQFHPEHILIKVNELTSESAALTKIKDIQKKLKQGESFTALAKQYSEDGSASNGGDLGWVNLGEMVPEFEHAMKTLSKDQVSEPVRTSFGWHLLRILDTRDENISDVQEKMAIKQKIGAQKAEHIYVEWMSQLRASAHVINRLNEN